ncbi:MAG: PilZ domain-containing protein [Nitrospira sp.]|nr:PilZ domain-containing protein [Nitrospira sp.]MDH4370939.1 PilZ domain-containing protein [Nitrospira sp.]MDH5496291.1 PilZ domain-containing protein [Nitrospira sp.]MDH5726860.1 PilZ domain-containing protein [Nitrospira sp.]
MRQESRKVKRFAVQLPCTFKTTDDKLDGTVLNLSAHGCAFTAECPPGNATYLSLEIDLLDGQAPVDIELAAVRWVSGHRCGIEFIRVSQDRQMRLKAFVLVLEQTP